MVGGDKVGKVGRGGGGHARKGTRRKIGKRGLIRRKE